MLLLVGPVTAGLLVILVCGLCSSAPLVYEVCQGVDEDFGLIQRVFLAADVDMWTVGGAGVGVDGGCES